MCVFVGGVMIWSIPSVPEIAVMQTTLHTSSWTLSICYVDSVRLMGSISETAGSSSQKIVCWNTPLWCHKELWHLNIAFQALAPQPQTAFQKCWKLNRASLLAQPRIAVNRGLKKNKLVFLCEAAKWIWCENRHNPDPMIYISANNVPCEIVCNEKDKPSQQNSTTEVFTLNWW